MKRLFAAALVAGAVLTASVSAAEAGTIGIDFGCDGTTTPENGGWLRYASDI